ncbi:MFS transporter [Jiangella alba]|uniref:Predicted arabinose efflux permease, MFS family n=1 Tax=Jiangella alba TaxID=561176 RepID=A0A1H5K9Z8_9ACTN|nr:MFS transporter [Jiangella alba]SEE60841.1 Predicted arabinose efflux permease, MFS family [Jiangella alba]
MGSSAPARRERLLSDPDVFRYVAARIVSLTGSAVTFIAMPVLIYGITGSATWTSLVIVAEAVPYLVFGLWAGALADHADRRRMMVGADLMAAIALATVPVAFWFDSLTAVHVLVAAFVVRTIYVFFDAANQGALPTLVGRERLPAANALVAGGSTVAETVVPTLAGALIVVISPASIIAIDVLTFVASALLIRGIVRPLTGARPAQSTLRLSAVAEGTRFILRHEIIRVMIVIGVLVAFSAGSLMAILVVWADRTLGVQEGDWRLGMLFGAWGIGAVVGSILMPRLMRAFGGARAALIVLPFAAASGVTVALAETWLTGALAIAGWSLMYLVIATISVTLRQQVTPERLMSRVMTAGRMATFGVGYPLGAVAAGALAGVFDTDEAVLVCQLSLVLAAIIAWLSPLRSAPKRLDVAEG